MGLMARQAPLNPEFAALKVRLEDPVARALSSWARLAAFNPILVGFELLKC